MSEQSVLLPPPDWKPVTLGQVSECILGGTPSTEIPQFWNGDVPWMASGDVHIRRIRDVPGRITALGLRSSNATLTNPPAVAVGLAGQGKTRGTVALTLCTLSTNQSIALLKANGSYLRTDYLFHNLDRRYEELRARSSGGGRGGLSKAILEAVPIDLPPLSDQQKIAQVLDTLDIAIHETKAIIAKLKAVKQGLLHDLLTRGIDANGELRPLQAEAPHLYKQSPLGWIPKEWGLKPLGHILTEPTKNGLYKPSQFHGRGPLMVQMGGLFAGDAATFSTATRVQVTPFEFNTFGLSEGDLLFARRSLVFEGAGQCVIVRNLTEPATFESSIVRVRVRQNEAHPEFVCQFLRGHRSSEQRRTLIRQVAVSGVSGSDIRELLIALPSLEEQGWAISRQLEMQARIDLELASAAKLRSQKSGLMDDLLTGRVRVTPLLAEAAQQKGSA